MKKMMSKMFFVGMGTLACAVACTAAWGSPETDFVSAFKAGKPLSAEAAYRSLTEGKAAVSPIRHFQAAEVADLCGKATLRRDRLALFVRQETGWTPEVEQALWILCASGVDVAQFSRLSANVGKEGDDSVWRVGCDMLGRLEAQNRPGEILKLAGVLLTRFSASDGRVRHVLEVLWNNAQRNDAKNYPGRELANLLGKVPSAAKFSRWADFIYSGNHSAAFERPYVLRCAVRNGAAHDGALHRCLSRLDDNGFINSKDEKTVLDREEMLELAKNPKVKALCLDGEHPWSAIYYFRAANNYPNVFFQNVSTNVLGKGVVPGMDELLKACRAATAEGAKRDGSIAYHSRDLISNAVGRNRLSDAARKACAVEMMTNRNWSIWWALEYGPDGDPRTACDREKSVKPLEDFCAKWPKYADEARQNELGRYAAANDAASVKRICEKAMLSGHDFDADRYIGVFSRSDFTAMTVAQKADFLKSVYAKTGCNGAWLKFKGWVEKPNKGWGGYAFYTNAAVTAFAATIRDGAAGTDALLNLQRRMAQAKNAAAAHPVMAELVKAYPSAWGEAKDPRDNAIFHSCVERYYNLCNGNAGDAKKWIETMKPKLSKKGTNWDWCYWIMNRINNYDEWLAYRRRQAEVLGTHDELSGCYPRKNGFEKPHDGIDVKKMSAQKAFDWTWDNYCRMKDGQPKVDMWVNLYKSRPLAEQCDQALYHFCARLYELSYTSLTNTVGYEALSDHIYRDPKRFGEDPRRYLLYAATRQGKQEDGFRRYVKWLATRPTWERLRFASSLVRDSLSVRGADGRDNHRQLLMPDRIEEIVRTVMLPIMKAVPDRAAGSVAIAWEGGFWARIRDARGAFTPILEGEKKRDGDPAKVATFDAFYREFARLELAGARNDDGNSPEYWAWSLLSDACLAKSNSVEIARYARRAGSGNHRWNLWQQDAIREIEKMAGCGNDEAFYLYVNAVGEHEAQPTALVAKYRAALSAKIPGVYPVGENDPAYPLYVAADEYARHNSERAWQIMQDRRNMTTFEREAIKLPTEFVVWTVEQYRMARGEKDALLQKARQIASAVLAQQEKVTPELAAAMRLTRAECYRDEQNFEAAKTEYQTIRDRPALHETKYGRQAMFRAVDLMIVSGNAAAVEQTLEFWLSQSDPEIQAQAHYFLALIAFERKDWEETVKQLRQTFAIDYTHTEGRILHAKWKLATNNEVDDTDVLLGDLSNRNLIRPGNQLNISVQDANLSVAGGGASIPVIVTAEPGGDVERVNLYPSSRDPSVFRGLVDVELGRAMPSNRTLQVRGDDTVSYVIDPDFLRERGLPLNEPRRLKVVDDGKLAIGAGAPRTDEKKTEKGMKGLLQDERNLEDSGVARSLRPGNPLYVVVQDRDCSFGAADNTVAITVQTSSGDKISNLALAEEEPFAGVFRGKIPTALPPPRAFASDTAAGLNAGDAINAAKTTVWKSLDDGQPGKWFEVDTMASYVMSNVTLKTASVADVKRIRLVGRMGTRVMTLGSLPASDAKAKLCLRRQHQYNDRAPRSLGPLRAFCSTDKAVKSSVVSNLTFRSLHGGDNWRAQSCYYSGPFVMPDGYDHLRFRIQAANLQREDALKNAWIAVAVDGEEAFSGQGVNLQNQIFTVDCTAGCHRFEMGVFAGTGADGFDLMWEPVGEEARAVPYDWFDESKHPELVDFVKDVATISRTEDGFVADFAKPTRLRSLRWEFADVKSPDVQIEKMFAVDADGNQVLPVASDFSCSLDNDTLEVAPGDLITVRYEDRRTTSGERKTIQRDIRSSFNNAKARFVFEEPNERGDVMAYDAYRFQPGDTLTVCVEDSDLDVSDDADTAVVRITSSEGRSFERKLEELRPKWSGAGDADLYGLHSGIFYGKLRTCEAGNTNAPASVLRVKEGELLTVTYEDRENTDPGVPTERSAKIQSIHAGSPVITLFDTVRTREVDKSSDAKVKLERIRRRAGNENVEIVYRDVYAARPMDMKALAADAPALVNVAAPIPLRVNDPSRARHSGSKIYVEAVSQSEIDLAESEGRDPDKIRLPLLLNGSLAPFKLLRGAESAREARTSGSFNGVIRLSLGPIDPNIEIPENAPPVLCVTGNDKIIVNVLSEDGQSVISQTLQLVSNAEFGLVDSSLEAERNSAHVGESFFVKVDDADRDATDEPDTVEAWAVSSLSGVKRPLVLKETLPHSGVFAGRLRPVMFAAGETIPSVATGGVATAEEVLREERFAVKYGDKVIFTYADEKVLPGTDARTLSATGTVFRGANGDVRMFAKRFRDRDSAVLVQFRVAECLFEQAKEYRKLKQSEKSSEAIAEGKFILEDALKSYPDSSHIAQGEYLLANLYQELANEAKAGGDKEKATPLYQEALSRFSQILGTWPDSEYAARSQYHKAYCLEMLGDHERASEEYVKMTYIYPESDLVGEATIRLATYYFTQEKRYDISGRIYRNFQERFPQHEKAARALFMAGSCFIKQAEALNAENEKRKAAKKAVIPGVDQKVADCYRDAVKTFDMLVEQYRDTAPAKLKAQTLYWAGDVSVKRHDFTKAYQYLKRTVFEYPETEWARRARGLLLQEARAFKEFE